MPALLDDPPVAIEALKFAAADSLPAVAPHNRHKPRDATRVLLQIGICCALIVFGVVLRAWQLPQVPGVNGDEAWYGVQSQRFLDEYIFGKGLPEAERVSLRTPTGNVWNPFLMIPRLVLDATFEPSVWSLRLPALISGVLTLLFNWLLCRRAMGRMTAWHTTTLLAMLPVALIYSRLGWDACQSILFCLPLVYLPWIAERRSMSAARTAIYFAFALAAAVVVHPTNIFLLPLCAALVWPRVCAALKLDLSLQARALLTAVAIGAAFRLGISRGAWAGGELWNAMSALTSWVDDVVGLFNGATVYGSISLPAEELPAAKGLLLLLSLPTLALLIGTRISCKTTLFPQKTDNAEDRYAALFDGTCLSLLCFLGVAGPGAMHPGYERYGLWVVAPVTLLIVMSYRRWSRRSHQAHRGIAILVGVQVSLLLAGYWQYYQRRFAVPAADQKLAHWTYRADNFAGWAELQQELQQSLTTQPEHTRKVILIEANDPQRWWFEWKWRYLSHGSAYEWQVLPSAFVSQNSKSAGEHRWILSSQQESEKENLAIQYLAD